MEKKPVKLCQSLPTLDQELGGTTRLTLLVYYGLVCLLTALLV